jgi:hypothetical protein
LTARSGWGVDNGGEAPVGASGRVRPVSAVDALRGRLQFPAGCGGQADQLGCLVMSSPGPTKWVGPGMERSGAASSAQSHDDDPAWGHADLRAGLLAASERHPPAAGARQRMWPSRRP